jgi:hypothetical protein
MRATSDAMPEAAGGEGGHGAAKLDPLIHRYRLTRGRKVMSSNAGLVRLREPRPLYQARDQVIRGADGEPTGAKGEARMGLVGVGKGVKANLAT